MEKGHTSALTALEIVNTSNGAKNLGQKNKLPETVTICLYTQGKIRRSFGFKMILNEFNKATYIWIAVIYPERRKPQEHRVNSHDHTLMSILSICEQKQL
jgi:hypothetical protein